MKNKSNKKKQPKKNVAKKNCDNKKKTQKKNVKRKREILLILGLIFILTAIVSLILFSDLFNITNIKVINNYKVSTLEIVQNSGLVVGNNMFKMLNSVTKEQIMANPYIEDVKITKRWNGEVIIDVTEREATYVLQGEGEYIYIDNQGYLLEKSQYPLELPIIKGYSTKELTTGSRLDVDDLKKLDVIIQIMETAKSNGINDKIKTIDITDKSNFILELPSEGKTVQFGDETNINVKILWIVDLITREKGVEGEIILNVQDIKKIYFREKV